MEFMLHTGDALHRLAGAISRHYDPSLPEFRDPSVIYGKIDCSLTFEIHSRSFIYAELEFNVYKGSARWVDHRSDGTRKPRKRPIDIISAKDWSWINRRVRKLQKEAQQ